MISYAGVNLTHCDDSFTSWIEENISLEDLSQYLPAPYIKSYENLLPYPPMTERPVKMDALYWPQGASRWAVGNFFVTESQRNSINSVVYPGGGGNTTGTMALSDGTNTLSTSMWMLPLRPISQVAPDAASQLKWILPKSISGEPCYLMTLVDDRYFWWQRSGSVTLTVGTTTWANLISDIATALGVTINHDTISTAYLKPTHQLFTYITCLPILLDMVAFATGLRVVRGYDGVCNLQNATNALASVTTQVAANITNRCAGGLIALDFSTGPTKTDQPPIIPGSVMAVFESSTTDAPHTVTVAMGSAGLDSSLFNGTVSPNSNTIPIPSMQSYNGSNASDLSTLATQLAKDYYMWQMGRADMVMADMVAWTPDGVSDGVEWINRSSTKITTRVQPGAYYSLLMQDTNGVTLTDGTTTVYKITNIQIIGGQIIGGGSSFGGTTVPVGTTGVVGGADIDAYRENGDSGTPTIYGPLTWAGNVAACTQLPPCNQILAIPRIEPFARVVNSIDIPILGVLGGSNTQDKLQLAIYDSGSTGMAGLLSPGHSFYPGNLLVSTGDYYPYTPSIAAGKPVWVRISIAPTTVGGLVWYCFNASNDNYPSVMPAFVYGALVEGLMPILGYTLSKDPNPNIAPTFKDIFTPCSWMANYPPGVSGDYTEAGTQDPHVNITFSGGGGHPAANTYGSWPSTMTAGTLQKYWNYGNMVPAIFGTLGA